jgi:murein L,D-transpeptidase YcbB/YkuD
VSQRFFMTGDDMPANLSRRRLLLTSGAAALALGPAGAAFAEGALPLAALAAGPVPAIGPFAQALAIAAAQDEAVAGFYRDRAYAPLWTTAADAPRRTALLAALAGAGAHGLPVARYPAGALVTAFQNARTEGDRGRIEVAMTRALLDYARDVQTGALDPAKLIPGIKREIVLHDRRGNIDAFAAAADPAAFLAALPPQSQEYIQLMTAKLALEDLVAKGGWGPAVASEELGPGASGPGVVALRDRLLAMGYLRRSATQDYDAAIVRAVAAFQTDHGLEPSGNATPGTMAEINRPPEDRLASIIVAMERERWLGASRGPRHIWVNLADFTAKIVDEGRVVFQTRTVIGEARTDKQTPEFSHEMTYMELNPDWTVPPGIIRREYLPKLQANPYALGHLQIIDRRGRVVPRGAVDFSAYSASNFPFTLRQSPGDGNALGKVKFMFPNQHSIYLHDTPHKELFVKESRAFSNGCVRLADPFDFAYVLLGPQSADPEGTFHSVLDTGRQERLDLIPAVPVHLDYRTAFANPRGHMQYRRDVYGRDRVLYEALREAGLETTARQG